MPTFEDSLNLLLDHLYQNLNELEENMLVASKLNLSISEVHMLDAVQSAGEDGAATISELSDYLSISLPSVTLTVNKLVGKGYAQREKSAEDGRVVRVTLTRQGRKAERAHRYFHRSMVREIAGHMDEEEKQVLMRGVTKLDEFLKNSIQKYKK